jgi:hypothetical protein
VDFRYDGNAAVSGRVSVMFNVDVWGVEVGGDVFLQEEDVHLMGSRPDDVQGRDGSPASNGLGSRQL